MVFEGVTISSGGETTISGTSVSLGSGYMIINGVTQLLPLDRESTSRPGIGAVIASMFGFDPDFGATDITKTTLSDSMKSDSVAATTVSSVNNLLGETFQGAATLLDFKTWYSVAINATCVRLTGF